MLVETEDRTHAETPHTDMLWGSRLAQTGEASWANCLCAKLQAQKKTLSFKLGPLMFLTKPLSDAKPERNFTKISGVRKGVCVLAIEDQHCAEHVTPHTRRRRRIKDLSISIWREEKS